MSPICEDCGADRRDVVKEDDDHPLWDWCAECFSTICEECMEEKGCCKVVPARSGLGIADRAKHGLPVRTTVPSRAGVEYGDNP